MLWDEIDEHLGSVNSELGWELGPGVERKMYFAVSPDLRDNLVIEARAVIDAAYSSSIWEFKLGRQRRPWDKLIAIAYDKYSMHGLKEIDLSKWRHIVFPLKDSIKFDIVFESFVNLGISESESDELASLIAIGLLGEILVMEKIEMIEIVEKFENFLESKAKPAAWLPYAFKMKPL